MNKLKKFISSFSPFEIALWAVSSSVGIITSAITRSGWLSSVTTVIGMTSLIIISKGYPAGQLLTVVFSVLYSIVAYSTGYYGEMITYLGMTAPSALITFISWLKHPYKSGEPTIKITQMTPKKFLLVGAASAAVTAAFYFILRALNTSNLMWSTASVFTSFAAVLLLLMRTPYYALAYFTNDLVLIVLWGMAAIHNPDYVPTTINFVMFMFNDLYGFISWRRIKKLQDEGEREKQNRKN